MPIERNEIEQSRIDKKYRQLSWLGQPTTPEQIAPDKVGRYRHYQNGSIYWHPKTGAHEVHGAIRAKWEALGWEHSFLGYPLTDETATPDGVGRFNHFQGGSIYWHPDIGAYEVHGAIRAKWEALGWEHSFLGYPLTDETTTPDGAGRFNHFQGGSIYWHPDIGVHEVHGLIRDKWGALGWEQSFLGYPVTDELPTADGVGRFNHFQAGSIYFHPDTGTYEVHGLIRDKWESLGWEHSFLGYPVTDELPTPDGVGRFNHFQGGSIYFHPDSGTYEVHGDIRARWAALGWEQGGLGYPISDEGDVIGGGRISRFQHGSIRWRIVEAPDLTFFQQNMALLPAPAPYKGTERSQAIATLIEILRREQPDVVGLSECFVDGERDRIKKSLRDIYPWTMNGPDEADIESDGGLLLLSRHRIIVKAQTIFRRSKGADSLANKGVLHARIRATGHPVPYDIFLSHTQDPNEGGKNGARGVLQSQLNHISSFIKASRDPRYPALLMGDLNTDALQADYYQDFLARLDYPVDQWLASGNHQFGSQGITSDDNGAFKGQTYPIDHPARHQKGKRIDYFLSWPGEVYWANFHNTEVVVWQSSPGRDISDHYGLKTRLVDLRQLTVNVLRPINRVTVALPKFHCLEVSGSSGSDEVYFKLACQAATGAKVEKKTAVKKGVDDGEIHTYPSPTSLSLPNPGVWLKVNVQGYEQDGPLSNDDKLGEMSLRLTRGELLQMFGRSVDRVLPRFTGDGGEYVVTVNVKVE